MGWWNNRGNSYNSPSGHGFLVSQHTRKPVTQCLFLKLCRFCSKWHSKAANKNIPVPQHDCVKNHNDTAASMEAKGCLEMVVKSYREFNVSIRMICADDDASTRSTVRWNNANYLKNYNTDKLPQVPITKGPNKGKLKDRPDKVLLPGGIPKLHFVSNPNHRKKILTGELNTLASSTVDKKQTFTKMDDALRLGKNFGYFIQSRPRIPKEQHVPASKAVFNHHFDHHENCGEWCLRKKQSEQEQKEKWRYY